MVELSWAPVMDLERVFKYIKPEILAQVLYREKIVDSAKGYTT